MGETRAGKTILVVDDTEDIRELMRLQLTVLGHRVVEASNGCEAVAVAVKERPALILMDLTMPGLDGLGTARAPEAYSDEHRPRLARRTHLPDKAGRGAAFRTARGYLPQQTG
jgi:CheY-like chemotaxis protein